MSTSTDTRVAAAALQQAFDALAGYDRGSGRGALQPIDDAVAAATNDAALRSDLEPRLAAILRGPAPAVAREYACEKLALIGGPAAVAALAGLLSNPDLAHAATNALQVMTCAEAAVALRDSLARLSGRALAGVITALGTRRDIASAGKLAALLANPDARVASAAAGALGEIGSPAAGKTLRELLPKAPSALRPALGDACLVCAERLKAAGEAGAARALLDALLATAPSPHVRAAALRINA
jgi:HEAT repeat protein